MYAGYIIQSMTYMPVEIKFTWRLEIERRNFVYLKPLILTKYSFFKILKMISPNPQGTIWQDWDCSLLPTHWAPPLVGFGSSHCLLRMRTPFPHVVEHEDQEDQRFQWPSEGPVEQCSICCYLIWHNLNKTQLLLKLYHYSWHRVLTYYDNNIEITINQPVSDREDNFEIQNMNLKMQNSL